MRHDTGRLGPGERTADAANPARRDRGADGAGVARRVDERICRTELPQVMDVAIADHRLAMPVGPALCHPIEVQLARKHCVVLDGVEEMRVAIELRPEAR